MQRKTAHRSAFTLIEMVVSVAIIAILAIAALITLNPSEYLRQSRDSRRVNDIASLNTAIAFYQSVSGGGSLGAARTIYLSLVDPAATSSAGTDCSGLGFPPGIFHCAGSSYARLIDGTGWLPINFSGLSSSPIETLPVDPTNKASTGYYAYVTDGTNWKVSAFPESVKFSQASAASFEVGPAPGFPGYWIPVNGNSTFGTSNFWVMKYEARCALNGAVQSTPLNAPYNTFNNGSQACNGGGFNPVSDPSGPPIGNVSHAQAVTYCQAIGAHLLTNDEYMTIAGSAAGTKDNWTGGDIGSGKLYVGHADGTNFELAATADDTQGFFAETSPASDQRRTFTLANGSIIWDIAGNSEEAVQRSKGNAGDAQTVILTPSCSSGAGWQACEFSSLSPFVSSWTTDIPQSTYGPSVSTWNSTQNAGKITTWAAGGSQGTTAVSRGGSTSGAGLFSSDLNVTVGGAYPYVGFRCAR